MSQYRVTKYHCEYMSLCVPQYIQYDFTLQFIVIVYVIFLCDLILNLFEYQNMINDAVQEATSLRTQIQEVISERDELKNQLRWVYNK